MLLNISLKTEGNELLANDWYLATSDIYIYFELHVTPKVQTVPEITKQ